MLITAALSLFLLFWSSLYLVDYYLRFTKNEKYWAFIERRGFSVTPFQIRFYVNRIDNGCGYSSLSFMHNWSSSISQRLLRFLLGWFSAGAFVGLLCFVVTPLYLTWLLIVEFGNVMRILRWRASSAVFFSVNHPLAAILPSSTLAPLEQEDVNFKVAISDLKSPDSSLFYVPLQEHVQTGITPVIPGMNIPWSHLPLFMLVLVVAGIFHELGHAIAAINANVRLNGFGVFLFAVYPGAFTELETDELNRCSNAQKLRIFTAGIWHNIILALIGIVIVWCAPVFFIPFYETGKGVVITDVSENSGLHGANGFQLGHIVTQINHCKVNSSVDWTQCLERMHHRQVINAKKNIPTSAVAGGYLVQYAKVVPLTASPANVLDTTKSGEVQCCAEFGNVTPSHICFRYYPTLEQLFKPTDSAISSVEKLAKVAQKITVSGGAGRANRIPQRNKFDYADKLSDSEVDELAQVESPDIPKEIKANLGLSDKTGPHKLSNANRGAFRREITSPAPNFVDSLGIKRLTKRSILLQQPKNDIMKNTVNTLQLEDENYSNHQLRLQENQKIRFTTSNVLNLSRPKKEMLEKIVQHACLPARQITDHASCEQMDELMNLKKVPPGYVCVTPALYNGTALLRFELKNRSRPVLFVGYLSEPLYMIDLMNIIPRFEWIPYWIPLVVELFGKYLLTFSLAMALLNAVPCHSLDGQFMCETIIDYFYNYKSVEDRRRICSRILAFGTTVFSLNVSIGLIKFLFNYWR